MYFTKKFKIIFVVFIFLLLKSQSSNGLENKILFKIENEIITSVDIYEEIKFLKTFNPETSSLSDKELFEISKNSIIKDKIKKIEIKNYVEELEVDEKFLIRLIKGRYSEIGINSIKEFENYLKDNDLDIRVIKEKFAIELAWNDLIYQKFRTKIVIDKDKIKKKSHKILKKILKLNFCYQK